MKFCVFLILGGWRWGGGEGERKIGDAACHLAEKNVSVIAIVVVVVFIIIVVVDPRNLHSKFGQNQVSNN